MAEILKWFTSFVIQFFKVPVIGTIAVVTILAGILIGLIKRFK